MLECNVMLTLFAHYICLHGYIHFIYLFVYSKYKISRYVPYTPNQPKNTEMWIFTHIAQPYFKETCIWSYFARFALLWPQERSQNIYFFLTEFMPFKFKYNSNFYNILVNNLNVVFQPIWQP